MSTIKKALSIRSSRSRKSDYEYDSQFGDEDEDVSLNSPQTSQSSDDFADIARRPSAISETSASSADAYLNAASRAMDKLQALHTSPDSAWKHALTHRKSGCVVYVSREKSPVSQGRTEGKPSTAPVFKGVLDIEGFAPTAVFAVMGTRKMWDDWYKEGSLVENLSDDSSLTYMCMKGIAGSSTRDLSLVEKVQGSPTGTICFATTSVVTPKVPRVAGRVRASIGLNGWCLEPIPNGTRVSYYLHVNVRTFVPSYAATKYLARRPTCIAKIADYLQKHGAPSMVPLDPEPTAGSPSSPSSAPDPQADLGAMRRNRRDSVASKRSARSTATSAAGEAVGLPPHVELNKDGESYGAVKSALERFKAALAEGEAGWKVATDEEGTKIWTREKGKGGMPDVRGEAELGGVTTEQVLGTLMSEAARRIWDPRFDSTKLIKLDNGVDQSTCVEASKGIFPSLKPFHHALGIGVIRSDPSSTHGEIYLVSSSLALPPSTNPPSPDSALAQSSFSGFRLTPSSPHSVHLTRLTSSSLPSSAAIKAALAQILASEIALAPRRMGTLIDTHGFAPHFLRWGPGPAELLPPSSGKDGASDDLRAGRVTFRIGADVTGTMQGGEQLAWLQWSARMYPRGLSISVEPADAAELARVETADEGGTTILQVRWTDKIREKGGAVVRLERSEQGDGPEDVYVGGEFLDRTVLTGGGASSAAAAGGRRKSLTSGGKVRDMASSIDSGVALSTASSSSAREAPSSPVASSSALKSTSGGAPAFLGKAVSGHERIKQVEPSTPSTAFASSSTAASAAAPSAASTASTASIPPNAMLIFSPTLYFTQQQVLVILVFVALAYGWGKMG
ncbi:hypothetical protein JCM8097_006522 [Rhodosporidiobolus ruineniae]